MSYQGDIRLGKTIDIKFTTVGTTGAPTTLAGSPVVSAYVGNGTTEITAGITLSVDFDGRTGLHNVRVVASSGNGFATLSDVSLVVTAGTVGGTSIVGYEVGSFSIENRSAVMPTTADATLDVSATGEAGIDWANVGGQGTTVGLTATTVATVTTTTTATNVTTVNGLAANVITTASIANDAITDAKVAADVTIASVTGSVGSVTGAVGSVTAMVAANVIQISGDAAAADSFETMLDGTGGSDLSLRCLTIENSASASPALQITNSFNDTASRAVLIRSTMNGGAMDITGKTRGVFISQDTGAGSALELSSTAGYGLMANGDLAGFYLSGGSAGGDYTGGLVIDASLGQAVYVKSEVTGDAVKIVATGGHGINVAGQGSGNHGLNSVGGSGGSGYAGTLAPNLLASYFLVDSGQTYSTAIAGSVVKEIADNAGGSLTVGAIADAVWDEAIVGHLTAGSTGAALNAAGSAGDPWTTPLPGAYGAGTAGFIVGTNIDALISSRMATYVQPTGFLAATFPGGTIANTTNITAGTVTTVSGNVTGSVGSIATGGITAASFGAFAITSAAIAGNAFGASVFGIDVATEFRAIVFGTSDSGSTTTMVDAARTEADTDYWKGARILFTSGAISGQVRLITGFNAATDTITFTPPTTQTVGTQTYEILPATAPEITAISAGGIADAVWDEDATGHQTQGSFGQAIGDPVADTDTIWGLVNTNLDALISSRMATYAQPTGFLAATFPTGTIANTTNITAGTITTVTNLTNAATAGDLTAAMKASVNTEVDTALVDIHLDHLLAVDYDPDSKPGVATALFNEIIGSDAGVSQFTANALELAPTGGSAPTVGQIADAVWDEILAGHLGVGSTGAALNAAGSAGDPWTTMLPGAYGAGTAGFIVGTNLDGQVSDITANVLDEPIADHLAAGSVGNAIARGQCKKN